MLKEHICDSAPRREKRHPYRSWTRSSPIMPSRTPAGLGQDMVLTTSPSQTAFSATTLLQLVRDLYHPLRFRSILGVVRLQCKYEDNRPSDMPGVSHSIRRRRRNAVLGHCSPNKRDIRRQRRSWHSRCGSTSTQMACHPAPRVSLSTKRFLFFCSAGTAGQLSSGPQGGAIAFFSGTSLTFDACQFTGNKAAANGGSLYAFGCALTYAAANCIPPA